MVRKKGETVLDQGPTSLFLFTPSSPLRRLATWICNSKAFETIITCTIILNCVTMMLDEKLGNGDRAILSGQLVRRLLCLEINFCGIVMNPGHF